EAAPVSAEEAGALLRAHLLGRMLRVRRPAGVVHPVNDNLTLELATRLSGLPKRRGRYCRRSPMSRTASLSRKTRETSIDGTVDIDGAGRADIETPLPFLSHMVEQIARHGLVDLSVRASGDVEIDGHHTTEDLGLVLGQCIAKALGDKAGLVRYGWAPLTVDEARATCAIDLSGRAHFVWEVPLPRGAKIGTWDVEL